VENGLLGREDNLAECTGPGGCAQHLFGGTQIDIPGATVGTLTAGPLWVHDHSIARFEIGHRLADGYDIASRFMAKNNWRFAEGMGPIEGVHL